MWHRIPLTSLFDIDTGDFNSYREFPSGNCMIISRSCREQRPCGIFHPTKPRSTVPTRIITISTVTGDAFVQMHPFYASDKVVLLKPRDQLKITTLFFVVFSLQHPKWRYSYGRSCFPRTIRLASADLPVGVDKRPDESAMETIICQSSYWRFVEKSLIKNPKVSHDKRQAPETKTPTIEMVKSTYQPTKTELESDARIDAPVRGSGPLHGGAG